MIINHNISSLNAWRNLENTNNAMQKSLEKLSSGYRINKAADDAAGLAISEKMRAQISGLDVAKRNAQDGISLIQTAEGAMNETSAILQRMRELAVQASNGTLTDGDRDQIQKEVDQLGSELDHIANSTTFNGVNLLNSSASTVTLAIGSSATSSDLLTVSLVDVTATSLVGGSTVAVDSATAAQTAVSTIDAAINVVSGNRADFGAIQNRLEHTIANLGTASENLSAAESRVRDVDMALEMANFTKNQILLQAGTAMLAQANQVPQTVLQLLR